MTPARPAPRLIYRTATVLVDPLATNTGAHRFYERLGFRFVERRQFDDASDCHVYKLDRTDWQG